MNFYADKEYSAKRTLKDVRTNEKEIEKDKETLEVISSKESELLKLNNLLTRLNGIRDDYVEKTLGDNYSEEITDVKEQFERAFSGYDIISLGEIKEGKQKYFVDTVVANITMMKELGLKEENIIDSGICSNCESRYIHSYRIDGKDSGRSTTLMSLI